MPGGRREVLGGRTKEETRARGRKGGGIQRAKGRVPSARWSGRERRRRKASIQRVLNSFLLHPKPVPWANGALYPNPGGGGGANPGGGPANNPGGGPNKATTLVGTGDKSGHPVASVAPGP